MTLTTPHAGNPGIARAKRLPRDPRPGDLAMELIDKRVENLNKIRSILVTDEYNAIANGIFAVDKSSAQNPSIEGDYLRVTFHVYMSGLNRWEDPRMIDFINAMTAIRPDEMNLSENKDYHNRDYKFTWKFQGGLSIEVNLNAYEDKATSECRRVQVGTKTVEQPVYRYDCVTPADQVLDKLPAPVLAIDL
jgi:hypothetical protein